MKPDWDKLMKEYEGNAKTLVGDVDCTAAGKPLCDSNGVKGFPTIKHGDPSALEDYQGGRDFAALKKFADGLKPACSPANIDLCEEEDKKKIEELMATPAEELAAKVSEGEKKIADAEKLFTDEVSKLQAAYEKLQNDKETTISDVKASGLGLLKSVQAHLKKTKSKEEL